MGERTAQAMETVFLEAAFAGDGLVDGVVCDVGGDGAVEGRVKVGDRICFWKVGDTSFDDGERGAVMTIGLKESERDYL